MNKPLKNDSTANQITSMKKKDNKAVAILKYHTKPITSVEWNVNDSTVFAASGEDNQLTIWDLSVEKDDEQIDGNNTLKTVTKVINNLS